MCTKQEKMDSTSLRTHLEVVHGIEAKTKKAAKRRTKANDPTSRRIRAKKKLMTEGVRRALQDLIVILGWKQLMVIC